MITRAESSIHRSIRRHLLAGFALVLLTGGGVGGWAATTELSGAVIAPGLLVVDSHVKKVQHATGGVVEEVRVRDGDRVGLGDVVVRLDETLTRASLAIITKTLDELTARQARLEAERDGAERPAFGPELALRAQDPVLARLMAGEQRLLELRRVGRNGQKAQLRERVGQLREQIQGLQEQIAAKRREVELIKQELEGVRELWRKNLVPIQRVMALDRDTARLEGDRGALIASTAQAKARITETELQILQIDQDLQIEVGRELAEIRAKISELVEKKVAAEVQLGRTEIRAPQEGIVHQLSVHTVGGVIAPGEVIMLVVPESDTLAVEAHVAPENIDEVRVGQRSVIRLSAFNQRTTPEIDGDVVRVSADLTTDQRTGRAFYTVRIVLAADQIARLNGLKLSPGMPAETFIKTAERTVLSYFAKPLSDQVARAFRAE